MSDLELAKLTAVVRLMQIKARVLLHDTVSGLQFSFYSIDIEHSACMPVMSQKFAMSSLDLLCFESHAFKSLCISLWSSCCIRYYLQLWRFESKPCFQAILSMSVCFRVIHAGFWRCSHDELRVRGSMEYFASKTITRSSRSRGLFNVDCSVFVWLDVCGVAF